MVYWHWFIVSFVLLILELLGAAGFLLWIGISAALMAVLVLLLPSIPLYWQLGVFAIISILVCVSWRYYLTHRPIKTDRPKLNLRAEQYVGQRATLDAPIVNGQGYIHIDDTRWAVECEQDLSAGQTVEVIATSGVVLVVKAV